MIQLNHQTLVQHIKRQRNQYKKSMNDEKSLDEIEREYRREYLREWRKNNPIKSKTRQKEFKKIL